MERIPLREKRGIALILTVGILALMTIIATSFAVNMMMDFKASSNSTDTYKAQGAAEAGIAFAIPYLRSIALTDFTCTPTSTCDWKYISPTQPSFDLRDGIAGNSTSYSLGSVGGDNIAVFSLKVVDTASQININVKYPNARSMLGNLAVAVGLSASDGYAIYDNIPAVGYITKEEVMIRAGLNKTKYDAIKDYITVTSYVDENSEDDVAPTLGLNDPSTYQRKSPVNINTASKEVLKAVLSPIANPAKINALADAIISQREITPFKGWNGTKAEGGFNDFIETVDIGTPPLGDDDKEVIKNNANPNKVKPSGYSTDFCFHPSGIYEITSTGLVGVDSNSNGNLDSTESVISRKDITSIVQIYKVINYTTKEQFRGDSYTGGPNQPTFARMTWLNTCPVESMGSTDTDKGLDMAPNFKTVPNSLKLGFWDNFDEDNDNTNKAGYSWSNWTQQTSADIMIEDPNGDGDLEMWGWGYPKFVLFDFTDPAKWTFGNNFSIRASLRLWWKGEEGSSDTGSLDFYWGTGRNPKAKLWVQRWAYNWYGSGMSYFREDITRVPKSVAIEDTSEPVKGKDYRDSMAVFNIWSGPTNKDGNERCYNIGEIMYGIPKCTNDHYNSWRNDENKDIYHGIYPDKQTLKLVVNSTGVITPNYRVYLAAGEGKHEYHTYDPTYNNLPYITELRSAKTTGYVLIPLHDNSLESFDRYGFSNVLRTQSNTWPFTQWYLALYANNAEPIWDDIRIIPNNGHYQFPAVNFNTPVSWGTASWTVTIPSEKETCSVLANTNKGSISPMVIGEEYVNLDLNGPIGGTSSSMTLRVDMTSTDDDYSETPVFEDITFTYLPQVKVLYRK